MFDYLYNQQNRENITRHPQRDFAYALRAELSSYILFAKSEALDTLRYSFLFILRPPPTINFAGDKVAPKFYFPQNLFLCTRCFKYYVVSRKLHKNCHDRKKKQFVRKLFDIEKTQKFQYKWYSLSLSFSLSLYFPIFPF